MDYKLADDLELMLESIGRGENYSEFNVDPEEVLRSLSLDSAGYFRYLYEHGALAPTRPMTRYDFEIFLDYLDTQGLRVRSLLNAQGMLLSEEEELRLTDIFWSVAISMAHNHRIRTKDFRTCLEGSGDPRAGLQLYLNTIPEKQAITKKVAGLFAAEKPVLSVAGLTGTAKKYLEYQMKQRFISPAEIDFIWVEVLLKRAVEEEIIVRAVGPLDDQMPEDIRQALHLLGLDYLPDEPGLKKAYRQAMMNHHPDRNPEGHDKSVELNGAYARLLGWISLIPA